MGKDALWQCHGCNGIKCGAWWSRGKAWCDACGNQPPPHVTAINPKGRDKTDEHLVFNAEPHRKISAALSWLAADGRDEEQTDGMIATEAIKLMEEKKGEPFFVAAGFFRPHTPFVAPKKYFDMYPLKTLRLPYAPKDDREDVPTAAFAHNLSLIHI